MEINKLNLYKVEAEEDIFVVVAESAEEAKKIVAKDQEVSIKRLRCDESGTIEKRIVVHYDYEDFYFTRTN